MKTNNFSKWLSLSKEQIAKLKRVENAATRLVMDATKYSYNTPILYELPCGHEIFEGVYFCGLAIFCVFAGTSFCDFQ